jgi:choline dehydrogenase-like flavoprotein
LQTGQLITARRGVVLAAGSLRTPQLLMLSGVGPAGHLRAHGVPVIADPPGVGANLHDHPLVTPVWPMGLLRLVALIALYGLFDGLPQPVLVRYGQVAPDELHGLPFEGMHDGIDLAV